MMIKILLVAAALGLLVMLLRGRGTAAHQAAVRLAGIALVGLAIIAIVFPGTTVWAAHLVGVQRGTDLVLYVLVMTFLFFSISVLQRFHAMEHQITELARELALHRAPDQDSAPPGGRIQRGEVAATRSS
jgi:hypothetical protein